MILSQRGFIEKISFLGTRQLPYRMTAHGQTQSKGSYFLIKYHAPFETFEEIKDNFKRDIDIVRPLISKIELPKEFTCTLHEETKPPAYRGEVSKMIKEADERLPINLKMKKKKEEKLKDYKF